MGNKNCCGKDQYKEQEERLATNTGIPENFLPPLQDEAEDLETFGFYYENIMKYLNSRYEIEYAGSKRVIEDLKLFEISNEELENLETMKSKDNKERENIMLIQRQEGDFKHKKLVLKVINLNYDNAEVSEDDVRKKFPLQYFTNRNLLKEVRILRNHINRFLVKCNGYYVDEERSKIFFVYDYYENSLEAIIKHRSVDLTNKIRIFKTMIELIKTLHSEGIISLDLSISTLRFTSKNFHLKLVSFGNSFDMKSAYDIDRNSKMDRSSCDVHYSPEIVLKQIEKINWNCDIWSFGIILVMLFSDELIHIPASELTESYKKGKIPPLLYEKINKIGNIYIRAVIIGLLRIDPIERPNIFEIIDIFNLLIKQLEYPDNYLVSYTQNEVLSFTSIFHKSTHIMLKDELTIRHRLDGNNLEEDTYTGQTRKEKSGYLTKSINI